MKYHDIKRKGRIYHLKIVDRTHKPNGQPTFYNMERRLINSLRK